MLAIKALYGRHKFSLVLNSIRSLTNSVLRLLLFCEFLEKCLLHCFGILSDITNYIMDGKFFENEL